MHARPLDMLHDARDDDRVSVGDRVDLHLGALQVLIDEHLAARHGADRPHHVTPKLVAVAHDLHRSPAKHVARPDQHRIAGAIRDGFGFFDRGRGAPHRLWDADRIQRARKRSAVLRQVDGLDARTHDRDAVLVELLGQVDRGLAAELDQRASHPLGPRDVQSAVEVERLEVKAVGGVEVGRHRLGVGVDEHGAHAGVAQGPCGVDGAIVELDSLADPNRARSDDDHGLRRDRGRFSLLLPARVVVGRRRLELTGARIDELVGGCGW